MKYLPRNRARSGYGRKTLFLFLVFLAGVLFFSFFDNLTTKVVVPLWRGENRVSRSFLNTVNFFKTQKTLREENIVLKERMASLELELSALYPVRFESEKLLSLLGRQSEKKGVTVAVLTHPPQSPYDLIVVDAGERDGLAVGSRVYLPEGPEVGVVAQVFPSFARVKLLSTAGEKTSAVLERFDIPVELEGRGGGNFKIILPRETAIEVGDRILSSSLESYLVAIVEEIRLEPTDSFMEVLAKSPTNIFRVRYLNVRP